MNSFARYLLSVLVAMFGPGFGEATLSSQPLSQTAVSQPVAATEEMPREPKAMLVLASKKNGFQNVPAPWHLKATYQLLNADGGVKETGTFEEYRVSSSVYKSSFVSPSLTQNDYSSEKGLFRSGFMGQPDASTLAVESSLFPGFVDTAVKNNRLTLKDRAVGAADKLKCVEVDTAPPSKVTYLAVYCFNPTAPILRISETSFGVYQTEYNGVALARGTYIASDIHVSRLGYPFVRVHLELLEPLQHIDPEIFAPPPDAVPMSRRIFLDSDVIGGKILHKVQPQYPAVAKASRMQGTVVVQAIIGKDGKVLDAQVISGPPILRQATLDCVRQWIYEPFLLEGRPVEAQTEVAVTFSMGAINSY